MTGSIKTVRVVVIATVLAVTVVAGARPAAGHEGEDEGPARGLVRQAIALIVNTPGDTEAIEDKIADAPEAEDTTGVDVALVEEATPTSLTKWPRPRKCSSWGFRSPGKLSTCPDLRKRRIAVSEGRHEP